MEMTGHSHRAETSMLSETGTREEGTLLLNNRTFSSFGRNWKELRSRSFQVPRREHSQLVLAFVWRCPLILFRGVSFIRPHYLLFSTERKDCTGKPSASRRLPWLPGTSGPGQRRRHELN